MAYISFVHLAPTAGLGLLMIRIRILLQIMKYATDRRFVDLEGGSNISLMPAKMAESSVKLQLVFWVFVRGKDLKDKKVQKTDPSFLYHVVRHIKDPRASTSCKKTPERCIKRHKYTDYSHLHTDIDHTKIIVLGTKRIQQVINTDIEQDYSNMHAQTAGTGARDIRAQGAHSCLR